MVPSITSTTHHNSCQAFLLTYFIIFILGIYFLQIRVVHKHRYRAWQRATTRMRRRWPPWWWRLLVQVEVINMSGHWFWLLPRLLVQVGFLFTLFFNSPLFFSFMSFFFFGLDDHKSDHMTALMCNRGRGRGTERGYFSFSFSLFTICLFTTRLHVRNRNHDSDDDERPAPLAPHANTRSDRSRAPLTGDNMAPRNTKKRPA